MTPRLTTLDAAQADLRWRGFSAEVTPDGREPYGYDYDRVSTIVPWKLMPGRYTREGDVRELLGAADDFFVVSRPGDELALSFDATTMPRAAGRLDAHVPAAQRRLQQGDGSALRQPRPGLAAAVPDHDALSVRRAGAVSGHAGASRLPGTLEHARGRPHPAAAGARRAMSDGLIRYAAAACQTDFANPIDRAQMRVNTDRMLAMIDAAVGGSAPFLPVRLIVFPEFAHAAPVFATVAELIEKLAVPIPNEHTDRLAAKAREHDVYVQSGTMIEADPRWPGVVFNTTCLIGPGGILAKYRKVNPWIPFEVHASPHDVPGYDEPLFPVVDTPIGRLGCAICYDWLFPEALRQLAANGAEVLIRVSAYMDPWGATEPMAWWTVINRGPGHREHGLRGGRQPGREPATLSAVFVAGRQPGRRLRRAAARRSLARARRAHRRRADRSRRRCATNARPGAGTTCWGTCAPRPTRSTGGTSTRRPTPGAAGASPALSYEGNLARIDAAKRGLE